MSWNHNLDETPLDRRLWLATKCGKVSVTRWNEKRSAWDGLASGEQPIAWQVHVVPEHPFAESPRKAAEAVSERAAIQVGATIASAEAGVSGQPESIPATSSERASNDGLPVVTAGETAPLILHKHIFLDDVGSGA